MNKDLHRKIARQLVALNYPFGKRTRGEMNEDAYLMTFNPYYKNIMKYIEEKRQKDLKKISHHFAIPVEDLEKALNTKDDTDLVESFSKKLLDKAEDIATDAVISGEPEGLRRFVKEEK